MCVGHSGMLFCQYYICGYMGCIVKVTIVMIVVILTGGSLRVWSIDRSLTATRFGPDGSSSGGRFLRTSFAIGGAATADQDALCFCQLRFLGLR